MKFVQYTDNLGEPNDCTVRSLACAINLPYSEAYVKLARLGRKTGKGFPCSAIAKEYGFKHLSGFRKQTVRAFCKHNLKGTFLIRVPKHVFCIKDGILYDYNLRLNRRITHVWLVTGELPEYLTMEVDF